MGSASVRVKTGARAKKAATVIGSLASSFGKRYGAIGVLQLRAQLMRSSPAVRGKAIKLGLLLIRHERFCRYTPIRIAAVKVIVAALPTTFDAVKRLLNASSSNLSYEIHFTFFCYLDRTELPRRDAARRRILDLLKSYLMRASSERAHAAWMCGDLLGDHWGTQQAIDVLCDVAENGKHMVARCSAVHGLAHVLDRASLVQSRRVRKLLETLAVMDSSTRVRIISRNALNDKGK